MFIDIGQYGSDNGLSPDGTQLLPAPMFTTDCWHLSQYNLADMLARNILKDEFSKNFMHLLI